MRIFVCLRSQTLLQCIVRRMFDPDAFYHYLPFMPSAETQFTPDTASAMAKRARKPRGPVALRQLYDFRDHLHSRLNDPNLTAKDSAALARAYKDISAQIMDMQGQGKPKPVPARNDPGTKAPKRKTVCEPIGLARPLPEPPTKTET